MRNLKITSVLFAIAAIALPTLARAEDYSVPSSRVSIKQLTARELDGAAVRKAWRRSLLPLLASQSLDAASSYGYQELNPLLADRNGAFGVRATTVKFAFAGALIGV